ncbi:MAG: hypothetical protein MJZ68_10010, partial [archaeon]|nr:hypothetical protein [archaeon]
MKGDLVTLRKICTYGSKTMLVGGMVIVAVLTAMVVMGIGAYMSPDIADLLRDSLGIDVSKGWSDLVLTCIILGMGVATVFTVYRLMCSIRDEPSPFTPENTDLFKALSRFYIVCSVILFAVEALGDGNIPSAMFMLFGCLLIGTVMYCFA